MHRFSFEREKVKTNDRLKSCQSVTKYEVLFINFLKLNGSGNSPKSYGKEVKIFHYVTEYDTHKSECKLCPTLRLDVMSLPVDCVLQANNHKNVSHL